MPDSAKPVLVQFSRVHAPATFDQVVRLVHQDADPPALVQRQAKQQRVAIEKVVVVAHHHIAPAHHFLAQVIRAHGMGLRQFAQCFFIEHARLGRGLACLGQALVKTLGQGAGFTMAGLVRVLASLVPRHQLQYPQRGLLRATLDVLQRIQREPPSGGFGGQEKHLVQALARNRLEHRKQGGHRLAAAGRRLGQQATPGHIGFVDGFGQPALPGTKLPMRKWQAQQRRVALCPVMNFLLGPGQKFFAHGLKK